MSFLPKSDPVVAGFDVAGKSRPHDEVGVVPRVSGREVQDVRRLVRLLRPASEERSGYVARGPHQAGSPRGVVVATG